MLIGPAWTLRSFAEADCALDYKVWGQPSPQSFSTGKAGVTIFKKLDSLYFVIMNFLFF